MTEETTESIRQQIVMEREKLKFLKCQYARQLKRLRSIHKAIVGQENKILVLSELPAKIGDSVI
jgi:hypothetical protein